MVLDPKPRGVAVPLPPAALFFENKRPPGRKGVGPQTEANVSADKTSVVSADKTSVVSADKTSVVSADKTSVVSQDIVQALPTQGRPLRGRPCVGNEEGMSWSTADVVSADTTDVLSADTTDVLSTDTAPCWRSGICLWNASVCVCEGLATPEAKKARP